MEQFILFGDSLTQQAFSHEHGALGPALTDAYIRRLDVINRGFSGYNTTQALQVLPLFMPSPSRARVRFFAIWLGANDARLPNTPGGPQQHVPLEQYKANLKAIATHPCVQAHQGIRVLIITPPPVDERMMLDVDGVARDGQSPPRRTSMTTSLYAAAACDVGAALGIAVLDLWHATMLRIPNSIVQRDNAYYYAGMLHVAESASLQKLLRDGLHLSRAGYEVCFQELMRCIDRLWPDQIPDQLPFVFPRWDDERAWKATR